MKVELQTCDKCGKEQRGGQCFAAGDPVTFWGVFLFNSGVGENTFKDEYDLCPTCSEKVKDFIGLGQEG